MSKFLLLKYPQIEYSCFLKDGLFKKPWALSCFRNQQVCCSQAVKGDLDLKYNMKKVSENRPAWWKDKNLFTTKQTDAQKIFSLLLPPPNVTGTLHLGHALTATIQDVLVKWHHMCGDEVLWIPGTDHAGIATQVIVERNIEKLGHTRHFLGKERFLKEVYKWQRKHSGAIDTQLKELGCSLSWKQYYFTMDEKRQRAVKEAFIRLFKSNLIYRKKSLVNWCCQLESTISDIEVDQREIVGKTSVMVPGYDTPIEFGSLAKFAYKVYNRDDEVLVATTRPETIFADVAVAVHPSDNRYSHLKGAVLWHPYRKTKIPIIFDESVDPEFGTGAVKITPGHSFVDYEISQRHNLELLTCISEKGTMTDICGNYSGLKRFRARELILEDMARRNILKDVVSHDMVLPLCSRTGDVLEVLLKPQWFVKTEQMAKQALQAVKSGKLVLEPARYNEEWERWLSNDRDWCISRQLWWGHRVPAFREATEESEDSAWVAAHDEAEAKVLLSKLKGTQVSEVHQDGDVLDTWFSSSLLPFSSLGWPEKTEELQRYYPLSTMITGHDILFFWAARMVMLGKELTGVLPFKKVLLHSLICDSRGKKMSKSLGNVITPENIVDGISLQALQKRVDDAVMSCFISEQEGRETKKLQREQFPQGIPACGVDALRMSLCSQHIHNAYVSFHLPTYLTNLAFCNKVWQACRFCRGIVGNDRSQAEKPKLKELSLNTVDHWILSCLASLVTSVNADMQNMKLDSCMSALQTFFRNQFCDIYIEVCKTRLDSTAQVSGDKLAMQTTLSLCIDTFLTLLTPFAPFLTEELFQHMPWKSENCESILSVPFPRSAEWKSWVNRPLEEEMEVIIGIVRAIREIKKRNGIDYKDGCSASLETSRRSLERYVPQTTAVFHRLANCDITKVIRRPHIIIAKSRPTETILNDEVLIRVSISAKDVAKGSHDRQEKLMGLLRREAKLVKNLEEVENRLKEGAEKGKVFNENHHLCLQAAKWSGLLTKIRAEAKVVTEDMLSRNEKIPTADGVSVTRKEINEETVELELDGMKTKTAESGS